MILCSSGHWHQQHRGGQGQGDTRQTLDKSKHQHLHIPNDSRPQGQKNRHCDTIRHSKLQSPWVPQPSKGAHYSVRRKRLQGKWSIQNLHYGRARKRTSKKLDTRTQKTGENDRPGRKSPGEAPSHRKVLLEDKNISLKTQKAFKQLCDRYDDITSKTSGDIGKTMLVEMEIDAGNPPPIASKPYTLPLKHYEWVQWQIETLEQAGEGEYA